MFRKTISALKDVALLMFLFYVLNFLSEDGKAMDFRKVFFVSGAALLAIFAFVRLARFCLGLPKYFKEKKERGAKRRRDRRNSFEEHLNDAAGRDLESAIEVLRDVGVYFVVDADNAFLALHLPTIFWEMPVGLMAKTIRTLYKRNCCEDVARTGDYDFCQALATRILAAPSQKSAFLLVVGIAALSEKSDIQGLSWITILTPDALVSVLQELLRHS